MLYWSGSIEQTVEPMFDKACSPLEDRLRRFVPQRER